MSEHSNHTVYAVIKPAQGVISAHLEAALNAQGWPFDAMGDRYTVAIPVYSHRRSAIERARNELRSFANHRVPIHVDEVRRLEAPEGMGMTRVVVRSHQGCLRRFLDRLGAYVSLDWVIAVPQSDDPDPDIRKGSLMKSAEMLLRRSILPGKPFDRISMKVIGPPEPVKSSRLSATLFVLCMFLVLAASMFTWLDMHPAVRSLGALVILGYSVYCGFWWTNERRTWVQLVVAILMSLLVVAVMSYGLFIFVGSVVLEFGFRFTVVMVVTVLLVMLAWRGCGHLLSIYPKVKSVLTWTVMTGFLAAAAMAAQFLIEMTLPELGLPPAGVSISGTVRLLVTAWLTLVVVAIVGGLGGFFGWFFYLLPPSASQSHVNSGIAVAVALAWAVVGFSLVLGVADTQVEDTWDALRNGETPALTSDMLFRACITGINEEVEVPSAPVIVAHGTGGVTWWWPENAQKGEAPSPLESTSIKLTRLSKGESACPR